MQIIFPIQTTPLEKITIEEVRDKLLEIQDSFFGDLIVQDSMNELNRIIEEKINKPYDLKIKAELVNNNVNYPTLKGEASKEVGFAHFNY